MKEYVLMGIGLFIGKSIVDMVLSIIANLSKTASEAMKRKAHQTTIANGKKELDETRNIGFTAKWEE